MTYHITPRYSAQSPPPGSLDKPTTYFPRVLGHDTRGDSILWESMLCTALGGETNGKDLHPNTNVAKQRLNMP